MGRGQNLFCKDCGGGNAITFYRFLTAPDTTINRINLCENCRLKRIRRFSKFFGAIPIQDEIQEIINLRDYLIENKQVVVIPNKQLIDWIAKENWQRITEFKIKIEQRVINTLIRKVNIFIKDLLKVPDEFLETPIFRERKNRIAKLEKFLEELKTTTRLKNWIHRLEDRIEQNREFLEDIYHTWTRAQSELQMIGVEKTPLLSGLTTFISGRLLGLSEERDKVSKYLEINGSHVLRFEDRASSQPANEACLDWAIQCDIYIGIFGESYGDPVEENKSATELEFEAATEKGVHRLIFIKKGEVLELRQQQFIDKLRGWDGPTGIIFTYFDDSNDLHQKIVKSINELIRNGIISTKRQ